MKPTLALLSILLTCVFVLSSNAQAPPAHTIVAPETPVQQAIDEQLQAYMDGGRPEVLRTSNSLIYPHGVYQPVLTCAVLRICIIELEPGEKVFSMGTGDHMRWNLDHGTTGPGGNTVYITVVPTDHNLTTNLIVSTDRRMYHLTLDSPPRRRGNRSLNPIEAYTRQVKFYYPDAHRMTVHSTPESEPPQTGTEVEAATLDEVNYNYSWRTENGFPWEPLTVFDDGERVYVRIPDDIKPDGTLLVGAEGDVRSGSYILRENFFIIESLFEEARISIPGPLKRKRLFAKKRQSQRTLIITRS